MKTERSGKTSTYFVVLGYSTTDSARYRTYFDLVADHHRRCRPAYVLMNFPKRSAQLTLFLQLFPQNIDKTLYLRLNSPNLSLLLGQIWIAVAIWLLVY